MDDKASYAVVGVFVVGLGAALVALVLWLGFAPTDVEYRVYVTYIGESVSGLNEKAPVKYRGVDVGRVKDIALDDEDPSRVRVLLEIEPGTPIKTDTVAILASQGITGIAFVELTGGSREAPLLEAEPGQVYPRIEAGPSLLVRLDAAVSSMLDEMQEASRQLKSVAEHVQALLDSQNVELTAGILRNVEQLTASLAAHVSDLSSSVADMRQVSGDAARVSRELPELVIRVRETLGALERTASTIADAAGGVNDLTRDARTELRDVAQSTVPEVSAALREVRALAQTLNRLGQELERDPAMLLRGRGAQPPGPGE